MKRFLIVLFGVFVFVSQAFSDQVDENKASIVANNFYNNVSKSKLKSKVSLTLSYKYSNENKTKRKSADNITYYYVYTNEDKGFVIVSGNDAAKPILGYSTESSFKNDNLPVNVAAWLEGYANQIQFIVDNNIVADSSIQLEWKNLLLGNLKSGTIIIDQLIKTKWNQSMYYNDLCPQDPAAIYGCGGRVPTGCVATATAQIMKYWNHPKKGIGTHSYTHEKYGFLSADFSATSYKWSAMEDSLTTENIAVATLMYHLGVAMEMNYNANGSSAYIISNYDNPSSEYALKNYFDYKKTIRLYSRDFYTGDWTKLIKCELDSLRPMIYCGTNTVSGPGHAFVVDGYDSNEYFHTNWGWGGNCDGWFLLDAMNAGLAHEYNKEQYVLLGIEPNENTTSSLSVSCTSISLSSTENSSGNFAITSNCSWTVSSNQSWLKVTPASGSNNATIQVTATANTSKEERSATITVTGNNLAPKTITVTQSGVNTTSTLTVSAANIKLPALENSASSFSITSNCSWTVASNQSWLKVNPNSGSSNSTIQVTANANNAKESRSAIITVTGDKLEPKTITVTQEGTKITPTLALSTTSINLLATDNSSGNFILTSNSSWTISSNQSWLQVNNTTGSKDATIQITANANSSKEVRNAKITITVDNLPSKYINVIQDRANSSDLYYQPIILSSKISKSRVSLRDSVVTLGEVILDAPVDGKVLVRFDGQCLADKGDKITLGGSNKKSLNSDDNNTNLYDAYSNVRQCFSNSKLYNISKGSQTFYALAENVLKKNGSGYASIYGNLTVIFYPSTNLASAQLSNFDLSNLNLNEKAFTVGQVNFVAPASGDVLIHYNGFCNSFKGDKISFTINNSKSFDADTNVFVSSNGHSKNFSCSRRFSVSKGNSYNFYGLATQIAGDEEANDVSIKGFMTLEFLPSGNRSPLVVQESVMKDDIDLRGSTVELKKYTFNAPAAGKAIVYFDGNCMSSSGDRMFFAASNDGQWKIAEGNINILDAIKGENFIHARVYDVYEGNNDFYAVGENCLNVSGSGKASIYGNLTIEYFPGLFLSVNKITVSLDSKDKSQADFSVFSNVEWNISSDKDWLTLSKDSGINSSVITMTAAANSFGENRTALVTIKGVGAQAKTITVKQNVNSTSLSQEYLGDVKIFPNPFSNKINIDCRDIKEGMYVLKLVSAGGNVIYETDVRSVNSIITLDAESLAKGVYFLTLKNAENTYYKTIVKE